MRYEKWSKLEKEKRNKERKKEKKKTKEEAKKAEQEGPIFTKRNEKANRRGDKGNKKSGKSEFFFSFLILGQFLEKFTLQPLKRLGFDKSHIPVYPSFDFASKIKGKKKN